MKHMKNAVIVSGGNIDTDFALDFLKKNTTEDTWRIAADRGLEFFRNTGLIPDAAIGDFDSLSSEGMEYLETLANTEIIRLKPEKEMCIRDRVLCIDHRWSGQKSSAL